ncbi:helicase-associated domain-containing protein [Herpetosiphon gulosus]|uniref:Helicase XPB/Ssl2 N-terminal domain-containing protein n=1 Tax=Herpetosiphon gulosus TaxID=1973496 RepID=A0ABP9X1Z1_9CHLR
MIRTHASIEWLANLPTSERHVLAHLWQVADAAQLGQPSAIQALVARLSTTERSALDRVIAAGGKLAAKTLEREFGKIRSHRDIVTPRAYLLALHGQASVLERLYILGLLQPLKTLDGEYYVIFSDWLQALPAVAAPSLPTWQQHPSPSNWLEADLSQTETLLTTILALCYQQPLRLTRQLQFERDGLKAICQRIAVSTPASERQFPQLAWLRSVALEAGLVQIQHQQLQLAGKPINWLEATPKQRLEHLFAAWSTCDFDEFSLTELQIQVRWTLQAARQALWQVLRTAPRDQWLDFDDLLAQIQALHPELLRSDFEQPGIHDQTGKSLVGWQHWAEVEGAWIKATCQGPLFWLGLLDIDQINHPQALRLTQWASCLIDPVHEPSHFAGQLQLSSDGLIRVPPTVEPLPRFQIQRITEWQSTDTQGTMLVRLTAHSYSQALQRGIQASQMQTFLQRWCDRPVPSDLQTLFQQWQNDRQHLLARPALLLEADDPRLLNELAKLPNLPPYAELTPQLWELEIADSAALTNLLHAAGYAINPVSEPDQRINDHDLKQLITALLTVQRLAPNLVSQTVIERVLQALPSSQRQQLTANVNQWLSIINRS